jgi:hypothetical protein
LCAAPGAAQPSVTLSSTTTKEALLVEGDFAPHFYQTNPFSKVFSRDRGERFGSTVLSGAVDLPTLGVRKQAPRIRNRKTRLLYA